MGFCKKKEKEKKVCIIEATIKSSKINYLDLDSFLGLTFFKTESRKILDKLEKKMQFDANKEHQNRCFLLDLIKQIHSINVIKYTFQIPNPYYGQKTIQNFNKDFFDLGMKYNQTQICATDNCCISEKKIHVKEQELIEGFGESKGIDKVEFLIRKEWRS